MNSHGIVSAHMEGQCCQVTHPGLPLLGGVAQQSEKCHVSIYLLIAGERRWIFCALERSHFRKNAKSLEVAQLQVSSLFTT